MSKVLLIIDLQNDYFPEGNYPLWHVETVLEKVKKVLEKANERHIPIILMQHIADITHGRALFFQAGSPGVNIHPQILETAKNPIIIEKHFADSFYATDLEEILSDINGSEVFVCGMMTQNCVTHTALSKAAEKYIVKLIPDCCTTVDEQIHLMALKALSIRILFVNSDEFFMDKKI